MAIRCFCGLLLLVLMMMVPVQAREVFLNPPQEVAVQADSAQNPSAAAKNAASVEYPLQTFCLKYLKAEGLAPTINGLLAQGETATINSESNAVVVRANSKTIKLLGKVIDKLDVPPLQVQVEARIIELKKGSGDTNNPSYLGFSWKYTKNENNLIQFYSDVASTAATSIGLYAQLLSGNTQAYLEALERTIGYDLVASPWITAINNKESSILIGQQIGYLTTFTYTQGTAQNINFLEVGTKLVFTPHINEDGYILMDIYPSLSEGSLSNNGVPTKNTTETKNKVLVKDGQTIVVGGLTKNYNSEVELGVPVLSSIPFIGMLFRRKELRSEKREIMVLITPHIVTPAFLQEMANRAKDFETRQKQKNAENAKLIH